MFLINCPYCGERDQAEFSCGGEAHIARPKNPPELSDDQWAEYLFLRKNEKGIHYERWNHEYGCRQWFNLARNTSTDEILAVYKMGEVPPKLKANIFQLLLQVSQVLDQGIYQHRKKIDFKNKDAIQK